MDSSAETSSTSSFPEVSGQGPKTVIRPGGGNPAISASEDSTAAASTETAKVATSTDLLSRLFPPRHEVSDPTSAKGIKLGHFEIHERIGMGGMGAVFRAIDLRLQRVVALKVLARDQSHDLASVERFRNEGQAAAKLDHDNIARVFYIGEDQGLHFIAFEFITGNNILNLIHQQTRMGVSESVNYILQIASALKHTASMGVVHRDVKPSNIIVTTSGRAKLVDWGLARRETGESSADLTVEGTTLGTFDYISPEQAKDPRNVDVRSDIYSLGCTFYHMVAGEPPYPTGTPLQKLLNHQGKDPPDPSKKNRQVSEDLSIIIRKMMASDPRRRYATPDHLIRDLMLVAGSMGMRGINPEGLIWLSSQPAQGRFWERHLGWMTTLSLLFIIFFVLQQFTDEINDISVSLQQRGSQFSPTQPENLTPPSTPVVASEAGGPSEEGVASTGKGPDSTADSNNVAEVTPNSVTDNILDREGVKPVGPLANQVANSNPSTSSPASETVEDKNESTNGTTEVKPAEAETTTTVVTVETQPFSVVGGKKYQTLDAACLEAPDDGVIEISFNGIRRESPLRITKKNLTIRAARDFRPILQFAPDRIPAAGYPERMVTVTSGAVSFTNIGFELQLTSDVDTPQTALFCFETPRLVRFQGVTVTVINESNSEVAVIEFPNGKGSMINDGMMTDGAKQSPMELDVSESFVRGNADLFMVKQNIAGRISVTDSALALDNSLLHVFGNSKSADDTPELELRFNHLSCLMGRHLVEMTTVPSSSIHITVNTRNSVFSSAGKTPLIAMNGMESEADARKLLSWSGDQNFYDNYPALWSLGADTEAIAFQEWQEFWGSEAEVGANNGGIVWTSPWPQGRSYSGISAKYLELAPDAEDNSAVEGAKDGTDAGADLLNLPLLHTLEDAGTTD
ncbi:MAG: hypothetical protein CMJ78_08600 [Planctomycetaceae bacterium]|nr:hypothetical protein [Planctomycetaceae bacterium]